MTTDSLRERPLPSVLEPFVRLPKWAKITAMVMGFVAFWPVGLAILFLMIWSEKMGACRSWSWSGPERRVVTDVAPTGNAAFDAYRRETLARLEDERRAFGDFLVRLREARDREEFERFMTERRAPLS